MSRVDLTRHELVPLHEILSEQESEELLKKYNITKSQLPQILESDPIAKKIKAKQGDVLRITRTSKTAGKSVFYRVVVAKW